MRERDDACSSAGLPESDSSLRSCKASFKSAIVAAAVDAMQRRRRVLVLLRSGDARAAQRVRRRLCRAVNADGSQLSVMTNTEVVCVDGTAWFVRPALAARSCASVSSEVNRGAGWLSHARCEKTRQNTSEFTSVHADTDGV